MDVSSSDDEVNEEVSENVIVTANEEENELEEKSQFNSLKILKDIKLICDDEVLAAATYRVYLDLCEVRKYEEVTYHYHDAIKQIYLQAKKKKDNPVEIVIPILSMKKYSFQDFENYQDAFERNSINIAIYDSSTIALYKLNRS